MVATLDDGVTPATDADMLPAGSRKTSVNGGAVVAATGNFVGDGSGEYYYEFSAAEVAAEGFVAFKLEWPGYRTDWVIADVGDLFLVGETNAARLRLPVIIFDDSSPPALALATVTVASQLQTSFNDVSFADAPGSLHQVTSGLHYYQALAAEALAEGILSLRFAKAGFQTQVVWTPISVPETTSIPPPSLVSITPEPDVLPGDPAGFPAGVDLAAGTPVVVVIANGDLNPDLIFVTAKVDGVEEVAYYGGLFRGRYLTLSHQVVSTGLLTLSVSRDLGWSRSAGQMTLTVEGVTPSVFNLLLPSMVVDSQAIASSPAVAMNHAEEMLARLPRQFKDKENVQEFVRALCEPIQLFWNTASDVLSHLSLESAFGAILRSLASRVGQSTAGLTDEVKLKRFIRARIAANRSSGTTDQLLAIAKLIIDSPDTDVSVDTRAIATAVVTLSLATTDPDVVAILLRFLRIAKKLAVRLKVVYYRETPLFTFNTGPGFNVGHLATSAE